MAETLTVQTDSESLTINTGGATEVVSVGSVGPQGPQGPQGEGADLSSPPPIGDVLPNTGAFTTLSATGTATLPHIHGSLAGNLYVHVKNTSGSTLSSGTPVYIVGNVGASDRVEVAAADYDDADKMPAIGLLAQTLAQNGEGNAIIVGELTNVDTSAYLLNTELYVGNSGSLLASVPTASNQIIQSVGIVSRAQQNTGIIVVNMQGERSTPTPDNIGAAPLVHTHSANDITSGTFNNARINFASPASIGSTTPSSGAFTTITSTGFTCNPPTVGVNAFLIAGKNSTGGGQTPNTLIRGHMWLGSEAGDRGFLIERQRADAFGGGSMPIGFTGCNQNVTQYNNIMFTAGFFAQLYLTTTSGNVGIMNDTPQARLDVNGGILARNTYTSTTNFERGFFRWTASQLDIGTEKGSLGGSPRNMRFLTDNIARITIGSGGTVTLNTSLALNAQNISTDTTTGTKIGTANTQKLGFFNATPVVQPTAVADATDAASVITQLNALLTRIRNLGLIAT